jgi:hypothetical protein
VAGRNTRRGSRRPAAKARFQTGFATLRDVLSFLVGVGITVHEVFLSSSVELYALTAGVALMGLPLVFGADEKKLTRAVKRPAPEDDDDDQ